MKINLEDKVQRFLVQEYTNKICHFSKKEDLYWNIHKLIHTFQVVKMAEDLIQETQPSLPKSIQKKIINAAVLHDIGRCYEYEMGQRKNIDHGKVGKNLILAKFPEMEIEAESTLFHNKLPSTKDPKFCFPILDYVRDADMLANVEYNITHTDIFLEHIILNLPKKKQEFETDIIDSEIKKAVKECRAVDTTKIKLRTPLSFFLWELCWFYNLQTIPGKMIAQKRKLFIKYKNMICEQIIPLLTSNQKEQKLIKEEINQIFPDKMFS